MIGERERLGLPGLREVDAREIAADGNVAGRVIRTIHPMSGPPAPGPYLQTVSGRFVNPFEPDPEQLDIGDITRALANVCRFGGHCRARQLRRHLAFR